MKAGRRAVCAWSLALFGSVRDGFAQPSTKVFKIGLLGPSRQGIAASGLVKLFTDALRDLGWVEGRNLVIEYRWSEQQNERLPDLARELVELGVDAIVVAAGVTGVVAAKRATATIPIVMVAVADPVKFGLVASFARPGGNVTGLMLPLAHWGKWLELAREAVPGLTRVAVLGNSTSTVYADYAQQNEVAAKQLGLQLQMIPVARPDELAAAFEAMRRARAEAVVIGPDRLFADNLIEVGALARAAKLPVISAIRPAVELGALLSWSPDFPYMYRAAAGYVDKILRGAKPADLAVEQPTQFELVINLKTAKALGLVLPQALRLRADQVIE